MGMCDVVPTRGIALHHSHQTTKLPLYRLGGILDEVFLRREFEFGRSLVKICILAISVAGPRLKSVACDACRIEMRHGDFDFFPGIQRAANRLVKDTIRSIALLWMGRTVPGVGHG
jgi:hypothetical protein